MDAAFAGREHSLHTDRAVQSALCMPAGQLLRHLAQDRQGFVGRQRSAILQDLLKCRVDALGSDGRSHD